MGRKIPGRKHHGVRDPEKQAFERFNKIKDKINAPPTSPEDQEIPKSLQRIIDLKNKTRNGDFDIKRKKKYKLVGKESENEFNSLQSQDKNKYKGKGRPEKPVPEFKQFSGETNREFLNRITRICQNVAKEVAFEEKYGVEIKKNDFGEVENVVKRPKDELEILFKKAKREKESKKVKKKKKTSKDDTPRLTKSQKWQIKKKEKKLKKKRNKAEELDKYKDEVKFGETVHAPPTLVAPKKVEKTQNAARPGKKNLLLKSIFEKENYSQNLKSSKRGATIPKTINRVIDKKGKRRDLPNALRRQLETQQKEIISAYKSLKTKKYSGS